MADLKKYRVQVKGSKTPLYIDAERHEEVAGRPGDMKFYTGQEVVGEAKDVVMWRLMGSPEEATSKE